METEVRVWLQGRPRKNGKTAYRLRWLDPVSHRMKTKTVGTDQKRALAESAKLEQELTAGTYVDLRRSTWDQFADEHVNLITGAGNRREARRTLDEFGDMLGKPRPRTITYAMIERYVELLKIKGRPAEDLTDGSIVCADSTSADTDTEDGKRPRKARPNTLATINKKLRYIRCALRKGVRRGYLARTPMDGWQWQREEDKAIRELTETEETALLAAAEEIGGSRIHGFIVVALATGGRLGELIGLTWDRVDLKDSSVLFTSTKGKKDRRIPIDAETVKVLTKLKAATQKEGGPFVGLYMWIEQHMCEVVDKAGIGACTAHDLRRSYISRLIRSGAKLPVVQRLAGHASITTTIKHYTAVNDGDLREAVTNLRKGVAAG